MTRLDVFMAAATAGGWVLIAAALFTAGWVIARAAYWTARLVRAAVQWKRDTRPPLPQRTPADVYRDVADCRAKRIAETNARLGQWHIDDNELADQLAIWTAELREEGQQ